MTCLPNSKETSVSRPAGQSTWPRPPGGRGGPSSSACPPTACATPLSPCSSPRRRDESGDHRLTLRSRKAEHHVPSGIGVVALHGLGLYQVSPPSEQEIHLHHPVPEAGLKETRLGVDAVALMRVLVVHPPVLVEAVIRAVGAHDSDPSGGHEPHADLVGG